MALDPSVHALYPPTGEALAIFAVCLACGILALLTVSLRTAVRAHDGALGPDDWLMLAGLVVFVPEVGLGAHAAVVGLGYRRAALNDFLAVESIKYLMLWMLHYVACMLLTKASICATLLRIGRVHRAYRASVLALLAVIVANFVVTFVGILLLCRPIEANWDTALVAQGRAKCAGMAAMIGLSYTSTAVSIATDLACAVLPAWILWPAQMARRTKIAVYLLLCVGCTASISTMIRTPYISYYNTPMDDLGYHVGNIVSWSVIETAIGLVAGSLPSLRRLLASRAHGRGSEAHHPPARASLVTFGRAPVRPTPGAGAWHGLLGDEAGGDSSRVEKAAAVAMPPRHSRYVIRTRSYAVEMADLDTGAAAAHGGC